MEQPLSPQQQQHQEPSKINEEIVTINEKISYIDTRIPEIDKEITTIQSAILDLQEQIKKDKIKLDEFEKKVNKLRDDILDDSSNLSRRIANDKELRFTVYASVVNDKERLANDEECLVAKERSLTAKKERINDLSRECAELKKDRKTYEQRLTTLRKERNASEQLLVQEQLTCKDGIINSASQNLASGLLHVRETFRIGFVDKSQSSIGLVERSKHKPCFQSRDGRQLLKPFQELIEAWSVLDLEISDPKFLEDLLRHVPHLEPTAVEMAWRALNFPYSLKNRDQLAEMAFQQFVYTPFAALFLAASGGLEEHHYKSHQEVTASLSVLCKEKEDSQPGVPSKICIMPDAAATLNNGWDVFGMMEVQPEAECKNEADLHDLDKCAMMTALTTMVLKKCMDKKFHNKIAIPFLIAKGSISSLYVTIIHTEGNPHIVLVGYPPRKGDIVLDRGRNNHCTSSSEGRKQCFVALAVLLNKFKALFEAHGRKRYDEQIEHRKLLLENLPTSSLLGKKPLLSISSTESLEESHDDESHDEVSHDEENDSTHEDSAKLAATCGGKFLNVVYPFMRSAMMTDYGMVCEYQTKSPFYFKGHVAASLIPTEVFLKVWKTTDIDMDSVQSEWNHYQIAFQAGVPVAAPVLDEIVKSTGTYGTEYVVIAVEYIDEDVVKDEMTFLQYSKSLVESVMKLHNDAGLLHCDLKPGNVCWRNGVVRLIDFGHSQKIGSAEWTPGTRGFQAPEILNKKPCTIKTDAFSVGRTILIVFEKYLNKDNQQQSNCLTLHDIALKLTDADPTQRLSLAQALETIKSLDWKEGCVSGPIH